MQEEVDVFDVVVDLVLPRVWCFPELMALLGNNVACHRHELPIYLGGRTASGSRELPTYLLCA